ncbi:probable disease resistance RPP8-like protein 4 [Cornus florida]|uniref:probable disease resistance RPP8-like protein 4 n=1 Tax=Cornus florida TaxID=4283 RepID=UPI0028987A20|nr:probable disease resistance RPP8-like protein 4 [Cornus florida]
MPILFSGNCRLLKVLELRNASLETVPEEVFQLFCLRYLSLRGTNVEMLPNSIGNLVDLETLDLKKTYVTKLPVEIQKRQRLRHLLVYRYTYATFEGMHIPFHITHGFEVPKVIGDLSSLQKLCYVDASPSDGGSAIVSELGKLTQLRRLGIVKLRREDGMSLCSSIEKLSNLRSLSVSSTEEDEILDVQSLPSNSPPQFLRTLDLKGYLEKLPQWILSLDNLVKLHLKWSKLRDDPLQSLQDLPNLMEIGLDHAYQGEELCFKAGGFQMLEILRLRRLKGLRWVKMEEGAMPHLEKLYISDCQLVKEMASGIEHLTKLQLLYLGDQSIGGADYWNVAHIPNVLFRVFVDGRWRAYKI